ncbi:MAG: hypothetical protein J6A01_02045 [Proteobacteria bacterium]|nr:hypothetical protein [Pseudomonadota bacterium]
MTVKLLYLIVLMLGLCLAGIYPASQAYAQESPDVVQNQKKNDTAHPALRMFSEFGMGTLFGTAVGGTALLTSLLVKPTDLRPAIISAAILYPAGIASGAILGGWLTDTKSGYWEPFVGAYAGALIADLTAYFLADDYPICSAILVLVTPIITTLVAMETSHYWKKDKKSDKTSQTVMPLMVSFGF